MTSEEHQQQLEERQRIEDQLIERHRQLNDAFREWAIKEGLLKWTPQKSTAPSQK